MQKREGICKVAGTFGYMSPEYVMEGWLSEKSDVFSFGVFLLEIVSGKKNSIFCNQELSLRLLAHMKPLMDPNEHGADPKTKKIKKKRASSMNNGEPKPQRTTKIIKTAA